MMTSDSFRREEHEHHGPLILQQRPRLKTLLKKQQGIHASRGGSFEDSVLEEMDIEDRLIMSHGSSQYLMKKQYGIHDHEEVKIENLVDDEANEKISQDAVAERFKEVKNDSTERDELEDFDREEDVKTSTASDDRLKNVRRLKKQYGIQARDGESFEDLFNQGRTPVAAEDYEDEEGEEGKARQSILTRFLRRSQDEDVAAVSHQDIDISLDAQQSTADKDKHHHRHHTHFPFIPCHIDHDHVDQRAPKEKDRADASVEKEKDSLFGGWKDIWVRKDVPPHTHSPSNPLTTTCTNMENDNRYISKNLEHQNLLIVISMCFALFIWILDVLQKFVKLLVLAVIDFNG